MILEKKSHSLVWTLPKCKIGGGGVEFVNLQLVTTTLDTKSDSTEFTIITTETILETNPITWHCVVKYTLHCIWDILCAPSFYRI